MSRPTGPALIAYDGSPAADEAIAAAGRLLPGRPVHVVHAWESPLRHSVSGRALSGAPLAEIREVTGDFETWLREAAEATVEDGVGLARKAGLEASGEAVESSSTAWRVLTATAETRDAAVIVAGSQGHGRVASVLLGSVSAGLVHHAERPVLIIRAPRSLPRQSRARRSCMSDLAILIGLVGVIVIALVVVGFVLLTPREQVDVKRDETESQGEEFESRAGSTRE